ncbi:MAG: hypothetical protein JWP57_2690 [Spirosoma sp.]|nr:hypothetical protein [Spirosoma sp.]
MKVSIDWCGRVRVLVLGLLVFACAGLPLSSAQPKNTPVPVAAPDDRAPVHVRHPLPDRLRSLQADRDYQYGRDTPPPENPLARFWMWLLRKIGALLETKAYQHVGQYVVLGAIAGLVIYLLMKAEVLAFLFPKQAQSNALDYGNRVEDIHAIDFDTTIDDAVRQRNYRLAVRLLYLQLLKRLSDTDRIRYKPQKTNQQYSNELANSSLQGGFQTLTRHFEFIWYGNFPIDESRFEQLRQEFQAFSRLFVSDSNLANRTGNSVMPGLEAQ